LESEKKWGGQKRGMKKSMRVWGGTKKDDGRLGGPPKGPRKKKAKKITGETHRGGSARTKTGTNLESKGR